MNRTGGYKFLMWGTEGKSDRGIKNMQGSNPKTKITPKFLNF